MHFTLNYNVKNTKSFLQVISIDNDGIYGLSDSVSAVEIPYSSRDVPQME